MSRCGPQARPAPKAGADLRATPQQVLGTVGAGIWWTHYNDDKNKMAALRVRPQPPRLARARPVLPPPPQRADVFLSVP